MLFAANKQIPYVKIITTIEQIAKADHAWAVERSWHKKKSTSSIEHSAGPMRWPEEYQKHHDLHHVSPPRIFHGSTATNEYWDSGSWGYGNPKYSWAKTMNGKGYPTLAMDELGNGAASHPDCVHGVQLPVRWKLLPL